MWTASINEFNIDMCKEYEDIAVEIVTPNKHIIRAVEKVYVEMLEEDMFIVEMDKKYFVGAAGAGERVYRINEDGSKTLLNGGY